MYRFSNPQPDLKTDKLHAANLRNFIKSDLSTEKLLPQEEINFLFDCAKLSGVCFIDIKYSKKDS
jgi:hypothetical protein